MRAPSHVLPIGLLFLLACSDATGSGGDPGEPVPHSIAIDSAVTVLSPAERSALTATLRDSAGQVITGASVTWTSSDAGVATVSNTGDLAAVDTGTAWIVAAAGNVRDSFALRVVRSWIAVAAGGATHACGITPAHQAYCWGANWYGELGDGTGTASPTPVLVSGGHSWAAISAGVGYTCGLDLAGVAWCWGLDIHGEVSGTGTAPNTLVPFEAAPGLAFTSIAAGDEHTCALTAARAAWCWGANAYGELGIGTTRPLLAPPTEVAGGRDWTAVDPRGQHMTCGITRDGQAYCWGAGMLGSSVTDTAAPAPVVQTSPFSRIAVWYNGACALDTEGRAWCWGQGTEGELGTGTDGTVETPGLVSTDQRFTSLVSAPGGHICGLTAAGRAWCWGPNGTGQLGRPVGSTPCASRGPCSSTPVEVDGDHVFTEIAAGSLSPTALTCGLTPGGAIYCWGAGPLGDGRGGTRSTPVRVSDPALLP